MVTEFDEKGKLFTDVVLKKTVPALIQTITHRIHGDVHVRPDERLVDEMNRAERFLAVTNAIVFDARGQKIYSTSFMTLNSKEIIWLIPDDELTGEHEGGGKS